jgi:hypothetical protein
VLRIQCFGHVAIGKGPWVIASLFLGPCCRQVSDHVRLYPRLSLHRTLRCVDKRVKHVILGNGGSFSVVIIIVGKRVGNTDMNRENLF